MCGSRSITNYELVEQGINIVLKRYEIQMTELVSGCATGPDKLGETYAAKHSISIIRMPALWQKYGISAGFIRNKEMADYSDIVISFFDKTSKGSKHMIEYCRKIGRKNFIFLPPYDTPVLGEDYVAHSG